jgi:hypothetical protein
VNSTRAASSPRVKELGVKELADRPRQEQHVHQEGNQGTDVDRLRSHLRGTDRKHGKEGELAR